MKQLIKISQVKRNPNNPRLIKDVKFKNLVNSIQEFPEMLELRPIVVDENMIVLGGNMRLKACKEAGLKEVWIEVADLTEQQKKEFTIKDNVGFGEWDWNMIANEWDTDLLDAWGLDVVKHDWADLDYIDEDVSKPDLKSNNTLTITIPSELEDERNTIEDSLREFLSTNFAGCEVQ
jgi:hypothetical protein